MRHRMAEILAQLGKGLQLVVVFLLGLAVGLAVVFVPTQQTLVPTLLASIVAIVAVVMGPYLTFNFTSRQFHQQSWWQKKAATYDRVLNNLVVLEDAYGEWLDDICEVRGHTQEQKAELHKQQREARTSLSKEASLGSYVLSPAAAEALSKLKVKLAEEDPSGHWQADVEVQWAAVKECRLRMSDCAKTDLRGT